MKSWKKFAIIGSVCLALGGGIFTYQNYIKPWRKEVQVQRNIQEYSDIVGEYKGLSSRLNNLTPQDFNYVKINREDQNEEKFLAYIDNLDVEYTKDCSSNHMSLGLGNNKNYTDRIFFDIIYSSSEDGRFILDYISKVTYGLKNTPAEQIMFQRTKFRDEGYSYTIDVIFLDEPVSSTISFLKDERLIKQVEELFNIASENYKKIESLVEKQ